MQITAHVFLVTGGGSGLGSETANMLAENGGKVVIADVNETAGKEMAAHVGGMVRFVKCDVTDEASMQGAVDFALSQFGAIHGLVKWDPLESTCRHASLSIL